MTNKLRTTVHWLWYGFVCLLEAQGTYYSWTILNYVFISTCFSILQKEYRYLWIARIWNVKSLWYSICFQIYCYRLAKVTQIGSKFWFPVLDGLVGPGNQNFRVFDLTLRRMLMVQFMELSLWLNWWSYCVVTYSW